MKLKKELFDKVLTGLKEVPGAVHARDARLFFAKEGSPYPPIFEGIGNSNGGSYLVYATINGKTLLLERRMICSMTSSDSGNPCHNVCAAMDSIVSKPLEVLAMELTGEQFGKHPKWQIMLLRDGDGSGFIHDDVARVLS